MTGKTIIYLPNWLGDMVMATPMLQALRASFGGEIWAVGKPSAMHLYNGLDLFNRFIPYAGGVVPFLDMVTHVRRLSFETGVVLPHSFRSALLFFLGSVKTRIGYGRNNRGFMLTKTIPEEAETPEPMVEHYLRLLDALGVARGIEAPVLKVTEDEERRFDERFMDMGNGYVVFIIGAQYGPSKRWPDSHFAALADLLIERFSVRVYLLPGKGEEGIARRVLERARHKESVEMKEMDVRDLKVALAARPWWSAMTRAPAISPRPSLFPPSLCWARWTSDIPSIRAPAPMLWPRISRAGPATGSVATGITSV